MNLRAEVARSRHHQRVKQAAFDCPQTLFAGRQTDNDFLSADRDELDRTEDRVR